MALKLNMTPSNNSTVDYPLPKAGARPARLITIVDLGVQRRDPYKGEAKKPVQQVILGFDLVDDTYDHEGEERPIRLTTGFFPLAVTVDYKSGKLHEKSKLSRIVDALDPDGTKFSVNGDFADLLKAPCIVNVKHREGQGQYEGKTFANIVSYGPLPDIDGFTIAETPSEPYVFDFDNPTQESWSKLRDTLKVKVRDAVNYKGSSVELLDNKSVDEDADDLPY